jgi:hypothetical protein
MAALPQQAKRSAMSASTDIQQIAHLIQIVIAPVFLLAGIGSILNVLAGRLARVIDRARALEAHMDDIQPPKREISLKELATLDQRMAAIQWSIGSCTISALLVCLLVGILFISSLLSLNFARPVALLFVAAMLTLTVGLLLFLREISLALRSVRVRTDLIDYK